MQLRSIRKSFLSLTSAKQIAIIERTNERRLATFEHRTQKATKKKTATKKKSTSRKSTKKVTAMANNPNEFANFLLKNMTAEERNNFILAMQLEQSTK